MKLIIVVRDNSLSQLLVLQSSVSSISPMVSISDGDKLNAAPINILWSNFENYTNQEIFTNK